VVSLNRSWQAYSKSTAITLRLSTSIFRAAEAAGQQGKFFEFHDLLFKNQETWVNSGNPSAYFLKYATELGLDIDKFTRQQRSSVLRQHIQDQFKEAVGQGFTGTPSFVLNGKKMTITSYDDFKKQIMVAIDPSLVPVGDAGVKLPSADATGATETPAPKTNIKFGI
jgi:protein-disulfide isomerase